MISNRLCRWLISWSIFSVSALSPNLWASLPEADEAYHSGDYATAIELYRAVDAQPQQQAQAIVGLSRSYQMTGDYDKAEAVCRQAADAVKNHSAVQTQLAAVLFATGRSDQAIALLSEVVDSRDATLRALVNYGEYLQYRGRFDEAEAYLSAAVASDDGGGFL